MTRTASELKQAGRYDQRRAQRKSIKTHSNIRERWEISSVYKYPCLYQKRNKHWHHKKLKRSWQRKKSKSRPSKKSLQSTLRRRQERSPALQRREEEAAGTDHHQYPRRHRLHYLGPCGQPSQDPCRRETSSAVSRRRGCGQGCLSSRSRSGGSGPGTSQGRHQPVPLYRVTGTRLSESKQIFKLRASLVFMTRG